MNAPRIAIISDDTDWQRNIDTALSGQQYGTIVGGWDVAAYDMIRQQQPCLVVLHIPPDKPPHAHVDELLRDDAITTSIPVMMCCDDPALLAGFVKKGAQRMHVEGSSCQVDEVVVKVRRLC
jgi:DNA-binding response OmpR family regulator